ncbi:MAG: hypothetical protein HYV33_01505 [Candidatus Kerfeldbacteria bacterium]|nr:hypothetical protein [Candidatus Kerfeldbacteria bacterium]
MDQAQLNQFKQLLLKQQAEVEQELATVAKPDTGDHVPGDYAAKFPNFGEENYLDAGSDSPDEVQAYEVNLAVTRELENHLVKIKAALERIANGTYGNDIHTGEAIALERLQANPAAEIAIPPTSQTH